MHTQIRDIAWQLATPPRLTSGCVVKARPQGTQSKKTNWTIGIFSSGKECNNWWLLHHPQTKYVMNLRVKSQKHHLHFSTHCESKVCSQSKFTNDPNSDWSQNQIPVGHKTKIPVALRVLIQRKLDRKGHCWQSCWSPFSHIHFSWVACIWRVQKKCSLREFKRATRILVLWPTGIWFCDQPEFGSFVNLLWLQTFDSQCVEKCKWCFWLLTRKFMTYLVCGWWSSHQLSHWFWSDIIVFWHYDIMTLIF